MFILRAFKKKKNDLLSLQKAYKHNSFIALYIHPILTTMNVAQSIATEPAKPQQTDNQSDHAVPSGEHAQERRPADIEALVQRLHDKWGREPGTGASGR